MNTIVMVEYHTLDGFVAHKWEGDVVPVVGDILTLGNDAYHVVRRYVSSNLVSIVADRDYCKDQRG